MTYAKALSFCAAIVVTAAGGSVVASPASARPQRVVVTAPAESVNRHISYADLNLASSEGERALFHRVEAGVNDLCFDGSGGNDGSFVYKDYMMRCSGAAWDQARPQMALAVQRAHEIAATGTSSIAATALTIVLPR
jgi:UrcA family protein